MKRGPKGTKPVGHPYYVLAGQTPIARAEADFMKRRIGGLATFGESHRPLIDLLANAYMLGLADATDASSRFRDVRGEAEDTTALKASIPPTKGDAG